MIASIHCKQVKCLRMRILIKLNQMIIGKNQMVSMRITLMINVMYQYKVMIQLETLIYLICQEKKLTRQLLFNIQIWRNKRCHLHLSIKLMKKLQCHLHLRANCLWNKLNSLKIKEPPIWQKKIRSITNRLLLVQRPKIF